MKTKLVIKLDLMKQKSGSITAFCNKNNINRQSVYNLNGASHVNSDKNKELVDYLIERGLASWEVIEEKVTA